jgi:hypothetical protein
MTQGYEVGTEGYIPSQDRMGRHCGSRAFDGYGQILRGEGV